jgi:hypothetical protein
MQTPLVASCSRPWEQRWAGRESLVYVGMSNALLGLQSVTSGGSWQQVSVSVEATSMSSRAQRSQMAVPLGHTNYVGAFISSCAAYDSCGLVLHLNQLMCLLPYHVPPPPPLRPAFWIPAGAAMAWCGAVCVVYMGAALCPYSLSSAPCCPHALLTPLILICAGAES